MTEPRRSDSRDVQVSLADLVAALIGRKLRLVGFSKVTWTGPQVEATHQSGDKILVWVQEVE